MRLTGRIDAMSVEWLRNENRIRELVASLGSPLNMIFPQNAALNFFSFEKVIRDAHVQGTIFYAHKPNKSYAMLSELAAQGASVDVASYDECVNALVAGFTGDRIEATGIKNDRFLSLALQHRVLVNIDSMQELRNIIRIRSLLGMTKKTRIMIRLCGFMSSGTKIIKKDTRFGIHIKKLEEVYVDLLSNKDSFDLVGFSFHLEHNNMPERVFAIGECIDLLLDAQKRGFSARALNIGGGFPVSLLESREEWDTYISALKMSALGKRDSLTWNDSGLGYRDNNGVLEGSPNFREHMSEYAGAPYLAQLLKAKLPRFNHDVGTVLSECLIELYIEPGKALLDHCGMTCASVLDVKESARGEVVVILDMNKSNLNSAEMEHMVDPILIKKNHEQRPDAPDGVYLAGNLCSYSDMIYKHKTFFDCVPQPGDVMVFPNTAGYLMDFVESHMLQQPIAEKIAVVKTSKNMEWCKDSLYTPILKFQTL